jgi:putative restriction endonuclease
MEALNKYIHHFKKLRRDRSRGGAPHKPILLLSILQSFVEGEIYSSQIAITPELIIRFKDNWSKYVVTEHNCNFSLPFFHMKSEPFWRLVPLYGMEIAVTKSSSIKSFKNLKESLAYAEIDKELSGIMNDNVSNFLMRQEILDFYFPDRIVKAEKQISLFDSLASEISQTEKGAYQVKMEELKLSLSKEDFEEEVYVRGGVFKREIPKLYNFQCAISGMKITTSTSAQMVDACHIVPFAVSKDDTITNGFALSPNLHRAFDRGLITINENFLVRVSPCLKDAGSPYSIKQFEGMELRLPTDPAFYPSQENFDWHRKERYVL